MKRFWSCIALLAIAATVRADQGNLNLKSIETIAFGPEGLLLIGSGKQIVSVETGDTKAAAKKTGADIANIDEALAGKLGLKAKDIQIVKLAVNPISHTAYVSVRLFKTKQDVLLTIDPAGKIGEFSVENVKYTRYPLAVGKDAVTKITDVAWAGNRIVAATQAGDTFGSRVFAINPSVKDGTNSFSTETYHTGHKKWETKAPILCLMAYEENGKASIVGSFTCTPIVKYPLENMQPEAKVKGVSVVELGTGNQPRSMFAFEKNGKKYILINAKRIFNNTKDPVGPSANWVARVDHTLLSETANINEKALWRIKGKASNPTTDRVMVANEYFGVVNMDKFDDAHALVIREEKDGLSLRTLALP